MPSHTTTTFLIVSNRHGLSVPHRLSQRKPLWFIGRRIGKPGLGGKHRGHAPKGLVIVAEGCSPITGFVVVVFANLELHRLHHHIIVARIAREVPVVDIRAHHRAALVPVVVTRATGWRARENTNDLSSLVSMVKGHAIVCQCARRLANSIYKISTTTRQRVCAVSRDRVTYLVCRWCSIPPQSKQTTALEPAPRNEQS